MPFDTNEALLKDLGWPDQDTDRRGSMTWATILADDAGQAVKAMASIVVEDTTLTLRLDTGISGGGNRNTLEATWAMDTNKGPALVFVSRAGAPAEPDETQILNEFKDRVNQMGVPPHFQPMAPRSKDDSPRRSPSP